MIFFQNQDNQFIASRKAIFVCRKVLIFYIVRAMKLLNKYILLEHIPPFIFSVLIITFLLILETIPKTVELVIDKELPASVVLEYVFLNLAWMIALSVPMAVLVATLLAFGRMTSDSEIVAIKSSGVNLLRIFFPLFIAVGFLTWGMIEFSDKVLPRLNHKARVLRGDIKSMRPTLTFRAGVFITDISGHIILIDKVNHVTSEVEGVRITDSKNPNKPKITVAKSGLMEFIDGGQTVKFTLYDGEVHSLDTKDPNNYQRLEFKEHIIYVGDVGSELQRTKSSFKTDREMNIAEMRVVVEKSRKSIGPYFDKIDNVIENRFARLFSDTLSLPTDSSLDSLAALILLKADIRGVHMKIKRDNDQIMAQERNINKYLIEIYKKYSIPASSFAFIMIGAPLAILSRRGGLGLAASISLVIFTFYWGFLIAGEDISDRGYLSPFLAMWAANIITSAIGVYLIAKVITEKPIFSFFRK